uniref:Major surface glycoprotein-related protein 1 n=1 Tax=Pneumocystis carinii TaxID=4754 RepID=O94182_PNECA|nr:major surface glycoprotein-related protein 1 [Pneumocystis carinii]
MLFSIINKIIVLGILILIVPTYSNQNTYLKARDSQESVEIAPFKDFVVEDEDIIVYILKEDYKDQDKCESKLEEYCKELKVIDPGLNKVHTKVKEICENIKKKCKDIKVKIEKKIHEIAELIEDLEEEDFFYEGCDQYYQTCMLFEHIKEKDVLDSCSMLRYSCYFLRDTEMRNEVILRAFGTSIIESKDFEEKKQEICPTLIKKGDDLVFFCLEDNSLENFNESIDEFCNSLSDLINKNKKEEVCHEKLGIYPLLKKRCEKINNKFKGLCEGKNITYRPPVKDFNPIEPKMTLLEMIDLENLYKEGRSRGLILGALEKTLDDMLNHLSLGSSDNREEQCKNVLNTRCSYLKTISSEFKELCEKKNKYEEKCKDISDITDRCRKFRMRLYQDGTSTEFKDEGKSGILSYHQLSTSFSENECLEVISECEYIKGLCKPNMLIECQNLKLACHKKKEDQLFIKLIGSQLYKLNKLGSNDERFNKCQRIVMEKCATFKNNNVEIFMRSVRPKEICLRFEKIISSQLKDLEQLFNAVGDSPKEKDCIKLKEGCEGILKEDCEGILKDLGLNNEKCVKLKERCEYFRVRKELKYLFLKEESDALADNQKCMKALKDKCDKLSKGEENLYRVSCVLQKETCGFMVSEAKNHCNIFKKNLEKHGILNKTKDSNETLVKKFCTTWGSYCRQLMENCPDTLKKGSNSHNEKGVCLQLKENCKPFWVEKKVEDKPAKEEEKKAEDKPAKEEEKQVEDKPSKEEVKPNEGIKIKVTEMIKIMFLGVIVMGMM